MAGAAGSEPSPACPEAERRLLVHHPGSRSQPALPAAPGPHEPHARDRDPQPEPARHPHQETAQLLVVERRQPPCPRRARVPRVEHRVRERDHGRDDLHRHAQKEQVEHLRGLAPRLPGHARVEVQLHRRQRQHRRHHEDEVRGDVDVVVAHHQVVERDHAPEDQAAMNRPPIRDSQKRAPSPCPVSRRSRRPATTAGRG